MPIPASAGNDSSTVGPQRTGVLAHDAFARKAVFLRFCTPGDMAKAEAVVRESAAAGTPASLQRVLLDAGLLTPAQVTLVVAALREDHRAAPAGAPDDQSATTLATPLSGSATDHEAKDARRASYGTLPGTTLGLYAIGELLGEGGMGAVFRAEHTVFKRPCALKILPADLSQEQERVRRFLREAETLGQVRHPNIVEIHNVGSADGLYFIEMELVEGPDLRQVLTDETRLPIDRAVSLTMQIANGLGVAHRQGIVHRDIKPANILLTADGVPKLADFGLARHAEISGSQTDLTRTGAMLGTPRYLAPERCRGLPADERSDIYALGVMFFEMLTGDAPFTDTSAVTLVLRHLNDDAPPPSALRPEISTSLSNLVERMLAKAPDERFQTADELVDAIVAVESGEELEYTARRIRRRRRRRWQLLIGSAAAATLAAGAWWWVESRTTESRPARIERLLREADAAYRGANDADARTRLAELATLAPSHRGAAALQHRMLQFARGREAWNTGDAGAALAAADALLEHDARDPRATRLQELAAGLQDARTAFAARDAGRAQAAVDRVLAVEPGHAESNALRTAVRHLRDAEAARQRGEPAGVVTHARRARATGQGADWANDLLDDALQRLRRDVRDALDARRLLDAEQAATRLQAAASEDPAARAELAAVRQARTEFDKRFQAALALLGQKDGRGAHEQLAKAAEVWPSPEVQARAAEAKVWIHRNAARAAAEAGNWTTAIAAAEAAVQLAPDAPEVAAELTEYRDRRARAQRAEAERLAAAATTALRAGDWDTADAHAAAALALTADHAAAQSVRAEVRHRRNVPAGFIYVAAGTYRVGDPEEPANPPRAETLGPFYLAIHEITNRQFARFVAAGGYDDPQWWAEAARGARAGFVDGSGAPGPAQWRDGRPPEGLESHPVVGISWYEADAFARWSRARLPDEVEWEVAAGYDPARGEARPYPWGAAWEPARVGLVAGAAPSLAAVGTRPQDVSALGCFDMAGNVMEWTATPWTANSDDRVVRGGSLHPVAVDILDPRDGCRVARRHAGADPRAARLPAVGVRLARDVEAPR